MRRYRGSSDSSLSLSSEDEPKKLPSKPAKQESCHGHSKEEAEINAILKAMEISDHDKSDGEVQPESELDDVLKKMEANEKDDPEEEKKKTFNVRCQYWPDCVRESACYYMHPKSPCKHFPNCYYGDKCFYIHPICPSNGKCKDKFCIYTHTKNGTSLQNVEELLKNNPLDSSQDSIDSPIERGGSGSKHGKKSETVCRYRGKCRVFGCEFKHPPKCKYGMACRNIDSCAFWHCNDPRKFNWSSKPSIYKSSPYPYSQYLYKSAKPSKSSTVKPSKSSSTYKAATSKSATLKPVVSKEKKNA